MVYCFNCKCQGHGFKLCSLPLKKCKTCNTFGHFDEYCNDFNKLCYKCSEYGHLINEESCKKHKKLKRCGAIIVDKKMNLLLVQNHSGVWSLPKGHQTHPKEPFNKCAMREVYEETGLKLKITKNFKQVVIGNIVYYLVELNDYFKKFLKIRDKDEVKKIDWVYMKDISNLENVNYSLRRIGSFFNKCI